MSDRLRMVRLEVKEDNYNGNTNYFTTEVKKNIFNEVMEVCSGDSGGPLVHLDPKTQRWTIVGTVHGGKYNCETGSGAESNLSIWNKVTAHLDWIKDVIGNANRCGAGNVFIIR